MTIDLKWCDNTYPVHNRFSIHGLNSHFCRMFLFKFNETKTGSVLLRVKRSMNTTWNRLCLSTRWNIPAFLIKPLQNQFHRTAGIKIPNHFRICNCSNCQCTKRWVQCLFRMERRGYSQSCSYWCSLFRLGFTPIKRKKSGPACRRAEEKDLQCLDQSKTIFVQQTGRAGKDNRDVPISEFQF